MTDQQPITDSVRQGASASISMTVGTAQLAAAHAEGSGEAFPSVLSTPALIGLIERACAATLQPFLADGEMSVGVRVNIVHKSPTALGQSVTATAQFTHREGRLFLFDVQADDAGGVVATGEHARAIVKTASIERQAQERLAKVAGVLS
jgi:fluoroacetyl-CoA thioesterase